jgi:hypothetical protein
MMPKKWVSVLLDRRSVHRTSRPLNLLRAAQAQLISSS